MSFSLKGKRVWVAGHRGMVGSAIVRRLAGEGCAVLVADRQELDLLNQDKVYRWVAAQRPDCVFLAAAKVGGIIAHTLDSLSFVRDNLLIQSNVFDASHKNGVIRLLFLGSSSVFPRSCPQPMVEEHYLTGKLELTNESYAIAKIAGIQLCKAHNAALEASGKGMLCRCVLPPNLYGVGDHFGSSSHAVAGMIHRMHRAKIRGDRVFVIWGTGAARREWMFVDDAADSAVHAIQSDDWPREMPFLNAGTGDEVTVLDLALRIQKIVGFKGGLERDISKPEGMQRKLMDSSRFFATGWRPKMPLDEGLKLTYAHYQTLAESRID